MMQPRKCSSKRSVPITLGSQMTKLREVGGFETTVYVTKQYTANQLSYRRSWKLDLLTIWSLLNKLKKQQPDDLPYSQNLPINPPSPAPVA